MVEFTFDQMPPSINKLYFHRQGRRIMSAAGRRWKNMFVACRGGVSVMTLENIQIDPTDELKLEMFFYFPRNDIYSSGWGKDKRVKSPFRRLDISNLIKITEDSISDVLGIDDRANFTVVAHKMISEEGEGRWMKAKLSKILKGD